MKYLLPFSGSTIRHALTFGGGLLVAFGVADADTANSLVDNAYAVIGGVMTIAGYAHSLWVKRQ